MRANGVGTTQTSTRNAARRGMLMGVLAALLALVAIPTAAGPSVADEERRKPLGALVVPQGKPAPDAKTAQQYAAALLSDELGVAGALARWDFQRMLEKSRKGGDDMAAGQKNVSIVCPWGRPRAASDIVRVVGEAVDQEPPTWQPVAGMIVAATTTSERPQVSVRIGAGTYLVGLDSAVSSPADVGCEDRVADQVGEPPRVLLLAPAMVEE